MEKSFSAFNKFFIWIHGCYRIFFSILYSSRTSKILVKCQELRFQEKLISKFLTMFELYFLEDETSYEQLHATHSVHYHIIGYKRLEFTNFQNFVTRVFKFDFLENEEGKSYLSILWSTHMDNYSILSIRNQRIN